jgi:hypothetical protein
VVEAVAVLAPWNDETCPLGDGRCGAVLDSVLDALRASLDVLCKMSKICELHPFHKLFRYYISPSHTSHTSTV